MFLGPRGKKAFAIEGDVEYDRLEEGIAIPKRVYETQGSGTVEFIFKKIEHGVSDMQDFTLSYYGLPETLSAQLDSSGSSFIWFTVAAFLFLILAILIRRYSRKVCSA